MFSNHLWTFPLSDYETCLVQSSSSCQGVSAGHEDRNRELKNIPTNYTNCACLQILFFSSHTLITTTTILSAGERFDKKLQSNGHSLKIYIYMQKKKKHPFSPKKRDRREVDVFSDIIMVTANFTVELLKWKTVKQKFGSRNLEEI